MTPRVLSNAGPVVAIPHRDDRDRPAHVEALQRLREPLLKTCIPTKEAMHLLEYSTQALRALLEMDERPAFQMLKLGAEDMPKVRSLPNE